MFLAAVMGCSSNPNLDSLPILSVLVKGREVFTFSSRCGHAVQKLGQEYVILQYTVLLCFPTYETFILFCLQFSILPYCITTFGNGGKIRIALFPAVWLCFCPSMICKVKLMAQLVLMFLTTKCSPDKWTPRTLLVL